MRIAVVLVAIAAAGFDADDPPEASLSIDVLVVQLSADRAEQRESAARELGRRGATAAPAVDALVKSLKDSEPDVAVQAAYALGSLGTKAKNAVPPLMDATSDARKATWGSAHVGTMTVKDAAWTALHQLGPDAADAVAKFLRSDDADSRAMAIWVLSAGGSAAGKHMEAILLTLSDPSDSVRAAAIDALGELRMTPSATIPHLSNLLDSDDLNTRIRACVAISKYRADGSSAVEKLTLQLGNQNSTLRGFAALALGRIGDTARGALPNLRRLLIDDDPVWNGLLPDLPVVASVSTWAEAAIAGITGDAKQSGRRGGIQPKRECELEQQKTLPDEIRKTVCR